MRLEYLTFALALAVGMNGAVAASASERPPPRPSEPAPPPPEPEPDPQPEVEAAEEAPPPELEEAQPPTGPEDPGTELQEDVLLPQVPMNPLGHAGAPHKGGWSRRHAAAPVPDRWRIGWLPWDRYGRQAPHDDVLMNASGGDSPYTPGHPLNPYDRNILKGDYPIAGDDLFLNFSAISDTFVTARKLPTPSGVSAGNAGRFDFFGDGEQFFLNQNFIFSLDIFKGYTAFRPIDWLVRVTPVVNFNHLELQENNAAFIDTRRGDVRDDDFVALQELFYELHLGDTSPKFDIAALRVGRQQFNSDFRGFIFNDNADGVRLLGNFDSNRIQYNLALFNQTEKDTNSQLNELDWRDQQVLIANLYVQDFIWYGYTTQFSFHWNHDQSDLRYDENGFLVRPSLIGSVTPQDIDAYYLGWAGDGHIDRLNVNHALYYVLGQDRQNPIAGRDVDISAFLGAVELSYDMDWLRPKVSLLYASGDDDPLDGRGSGFDGVFDNPFFAGGPGSFYQSQAIRLFGVDLSSARSFYNDLAGTKAEGQSNYVNPGVFLLNVGADAEITPKLRASLNANSLWFAQTETLELILNQNGIDSHIGYELNLSTQYRPALNNNVILTLGGSLFFPGDGFTDIYDTDETLWQVFAGVTLAY